MNITNNDTSVKLAEPDHLGGRKYLSYWMTSSPIDIVVYDKHH